MFAGNNSISTLPLSSSSRLPPPPLTIQVNASPAIKRRAFWNSDYSAYPPESDYATLGREYDAQNAAVVDAYSRLLQETTVRSAWKRPGCTARSCSPYTEGACSPESKECKTEAEMARKVGFVPLFGDSPSPKAELAGKEIKALRNEFFFEFFYFDFNERERERERRERLVNDENREKRKRERERARQREKERTPVVPKRSKKKKEKLLFLFRPFLFFPSAFLFSFSFLLLQQKTYVKE